MKRLACALAIISFTTAASAGPETALREFAGGQIKKGVRTIGMGGDGATTGNYALVMNDAGSAIFDEGLVRFLDTGNFFTFSAVGFTTPHFWNDAAFYVIALGQNGTGIRTWTTTPKNPMHPPSIGNLADTSVFVKFAKPLSKAWSVGFMGAYEVSQATLVPLDGSAPVDYRTTWLPSGGAGLHWHPSKQFQAGIRVILNHDIETRSSAGQVKQGLLRSYEYRLGVAYAPWKWTLLDAGVDLLDRSNDVEGTSSLEPHPTIGLEQTLVQKHVWVRAGLDETTWTTGMSVALPFFKIDLAYLWNLAQARTGDVFGNRNVSLIATINFDYERLFKKR